MTPTNTPHPTPEQWADFLYHELPRDHRSALEQHLDACPECRAQMQAYRTAQTALDTWRLPARPRPLAGRRARLCLEWAAAAALLIGLGLIAGRLTAPRVDSERLRADLRRELQSDLHTVLEAANDRTDRRIEDLAAAWETARQQDQHATLALLNRTERLRQGDVAWLRRDLDTLAVNAGERLDTTQRALGQLVHVSQRLTDPPKP